MYNRSVSMWREAYGVLDKKDDKDKWASDLEEWM